MTGKDTLPEGFKRCGQCRAVKPLETGFHHNKTRKDGHTDACKVCNRARALAHHHAHPEKHQLIHRAWRTANPEKWLANSRKWAQLNPDKVLASIHNRRAKKAGAEGRVTGDELTAKRAAQNGHCAYCDRISQTLVVDHIIPLSKGGTGYIWNICFACSRCNSSKHQRTLDQWVNRWYQRAADQPARYAKGR